jgi:hypothetical protein
VVAEAVVAFSIALGWQACDGSDIQMATAQGKRGKPFIPTSRDRDQDIYTFHLDASALLTMAELPFRADLCLRHRTLGPSTPYVDRCRPKASPGRHATAR